MHSELELTTMRMAQSNPSYEDLLLSEEDIKLRYITPAILSLLRNAHIKTAKMSFLTT